MLAGDNCAEKSCYTECGIPTSSGILYRWDETDHD